MEDSAIIDLYWQRSETAISETHTKYGRFCHSVAYNILADKLDAEESVNDTYLATWHALPPHRPNILMAFLAKLTRRISIDRWRRRTADKRGGGQVILALEELSDCAAQSADAEEEILTRELYAALNRFLAALPETERTVFLRRYFLLDSVADIAESFRFTPAKVTSMLYRTRMKLRRHLTGEGYV